MPAVHPERGTPMRKCVLAAAALAAVLAAGPAAAQSEQDFEVARQAYGNGEQLFAAGRFPEALVAFQQSYDLVPFPDTMFNIAACYEAIGAYGEAKAR